MDGMESWMLVWNVLVLSNIKNWGFDHDSSEQMVFLHLDARTSVTSRVRIWIYSQNIIFQLRFEVSFSSFWLKYWAEGFDLEARFPFFWNFVFGNFRFDLRSTLSVYSAGELFVGACDTVRYRACWFYWVTVTLQIGLSPWWIIVVGLVSPVAWEGIGIPGSLREMNTKSLVLIPQTPPLSMTWHHPTPAFAPLISTCPKNPQSRTTTPEESNRYHLCCCILAKTSSRPRVSIDSSNSQLWANSIEL